MLVWYMYESLTEESVQDGDVSDHGFLNAYGSHISMAEASGDQAFHLKHQAAREYPLIGWTLQGYSIEELAEEILNTIGTPDSVEAGVLEVIFYGAGDNATVDGEPYIRAVLVEGAPLDIDRLVEAVKPTKER